MNGGLSGLMGASRKGHTKLHKDEELKTIGGKGTYHSVGSAWSCLSNTPLRMYKHFNYEGGACSPLIAHWSKGIKKHNRWVRTPVHLMDIMPTLVEVSGATYPKKHRGNDIHPMEGISLQPLFHSNKKLKKRDLYFDHFDSSAIRSGDWKLVRGNQRYNNNAWELYNIAKDRCETNNLIEKYPQKADALKDKWLSWAKRVKIHPYYKNDP